jgi:hypothetical protein
LTLLRGSNVVLQATSDSGSIASAAASCTHLFVATINYLSTFEVGNMTPIGRMPWSNGGLSAPIIGPTGYVYAIADNKLHVFAPPTRHIGGGLTACDTLPVHSF